MSVIKLSNPFEIKGETVDEVNLDFNKLTGKDCLSAQAEAREYCAGTTCYELEKAYHAALAARMLKVPLDDLLGLALIDFSEITIEVQSFLFGMGK